jgi:PAS domain S-box-containing protein
MILGDQAESNTGKRTLGLEISFQGKRRFIQTDPQNIINLMVSIYQGAIQQNEELIKTREELSELNESLESLVQERTMELENELAERRRSEEKLQISEMQYRFLAESSPDLIARFNKSCQHLYVNPAAANAGVLRPDEYIGKDLMEVGMPLQKAQKWGTYIRTVFETGEILTFEDESVTPYGLRFFSIRFVPEIAPDGSVYSVQTISHDITERMQLIDDLVIARKKAEESDRLKSAFLANMSHEIRTPLNSIIGFSDLLSEEENSLENVVKYSSIIKASGDRLLQLINNLIDISKIESGTETIRISTVKPSNAIKEVANLFRLMANQKAIELVEIIPEDLRELTIQTDSLKLHQILTNLVNNALKFTMVGRIEVSLEKHDDSVLFFVRDTGIGISNDQLNHVFDRFHQVESHHTAKIGGAGLGLSLCKGLIELLNGRIWVESEQGQGSMFAFMLPG